MKHIKNILSFLPIIALVIGCSMGTGTIITISAILFLIIYLFYKRKIYFQLFKTPISKLTFCYITIYIVLFLISSLCAQKNEGLSTITRYLEKMVPFFLLLLYTNNTKKDLIYGWLGLCIGTNLYNLYSCYYSYTTKLRPVGNMGGPNDLGGYLIIAIPILIYGTYIFKNKNLLFSLGLFSTILAFATLIVSGSRGSLMGLSIAFLIGIILLIKFFKINAKKALIAYIILISSLLFCLNSTKNVLSRSYDGERVLMWKSGIAMFHDYPIFGIGFGNFNYMYIKKNYASPFAKERTQDTPHNTLIYYLSNVGIVGTIGIIALLTFQFKTLYTQTKYMQTTRAKLFLIATFVGLTAAIVHDLVDVIYTRRGFARCYWLLWGFTCYTIYLDHEEHLNTKTNEITCSKQDLAN